MTRLGARRRALLSGSQPCRSLARSTRSRNRTRGGDFQAASDGERLRKIFSDRVAALRDEDLRADHQPEFTQIDLEMSFPQQESRLRSGRAGMMKRVFEAAGYKMEEDFPRLNLRAQAMRS